MADVVVIETNNNQYLKSVNTQDFENDINALINPDITPVLNVPLKYWKRVGNVLAEMDLAEKQVVYNYKLQQRKNLADTYQIAIGIALTALVKVINVRLSVSQKITKQEMINAIKEEIT